MKKRCSCCNQYKSLKYFRKRKSSKDKLQGQCSKCINKKARVFRIKNLRRIKINAKKYRQSIKGIYMVCKLNGAKERNIVFNISYSDFENWYKKQKQICFYCGRNLKEIKKDKHHHKTDRLTIDRIDNNEGYTLNNIVLACWICNNVKSKIFNKSEMKLIGKTLNKILK